MAVTLNVYEYQKSYIEGDQLNCHYCESKMEVVGIVHATIEWPPMVRWCPNCGSLHAETGVTKKPVNGLEAAHAEVREATSLLYDLQQENADLLEIGAAKERGALLALILKRLDPSRTVGRLQSAICEDVHNLIKARGRVLAPFWPERLAEENRQLKEAAQKVLQMANREDGYNRLLESAQNESQLKHDWRERLDDLGGLLE